VDGGRSRRGRKVATLPERLVLALGQNESEGWTRNDYRAAVNSVPDSTAVLMVDTYRDPAFFGEERAATQARYSRWMARLAMTQPNVEVVAWRGAVLDGTVVLPDGSHPDEAGAQYRGRMTRKAVRAARS